MPQTIKRLELGFHIVSDLLLHFFPVPGSSPNEESMSFPIFRLCSPPVHVWNTLPPIHCGAARYTSYFNISFIFIPTYSQPHTACLYITDRIVVPSPTDYCYNHYLTYSLPSDCSLFHPLHLDPVLDFGLSDLLI